MNASLRLASLAAALSFAAGIGAAEPTGTLLWECSKTTPPAPAEVAAFYGSRNFDQIADQRLHLHFVLQRACAQGPTRVQLVLDDRGAPETLRIAAR